MEYGELGDQPLYPGRVTGWRASAGDAAGHRDNRPFAPQHADRVRTYREDDQSDWIGTLFRLHHAYDAEAMRRALWIWHKRHEAFRTTPELGDDNETLSRITYAPEEISIEEICTRGDLDAHEVHDAVLECFDEHIDPVTWPHLIVAVIEPDETARREHGHADGGPWFTVVFGADHTVMDAFSQVLAIRELDMIYGEMLRRRSVGDESLDIPDVQVGSYVDYSAEEDRVERARRCCEQTERRWAAYLDPDGRQPALPLGLGGRATAESSAPAIERPRLGRQRRLSEWLLDPEDADSLNRHTRARGHSMGNTVIAALCDAIAPADAESLRFAMTVATRSPEHLEAMGWYVGLVPVHVDLRRLDWGTNDLSDAVTSDELIGRVAEATAFARFDGNVSYPPLAERLGIDGGPRFVVSWIDFRHVRGAVEFEERCARVLRSRSEDADEVYVWLLRSHTGLTISSRFPDDDVAEQTMHAAVHRLREGLGELLSQGPVEDLQSPGLAASPQTSSSNRG